MRDPKHYAQQGIKISLWVDIAKSSKKSELQLWEKTRNIFFLIKY